MTIKFNDKYTAEEKQTIITAIRFYSNTGSANTMVETQEEFDELCEKILRSAKKADTEKKVEKNTQPGAKARRNYKQHERAMKTAYEKIEQLKREIAEHEEKMKYWAMVYEEETNKQI